MTSIANSLKKENEWIVVNLNSTVNLLNDFAKRLNDECETIPNFFSKGFSVTIAGVGIGINGIESLRDDTFGGGAMKIRFRTVITACVIVILTAVVLPGCGSKKAEHDETYGIVEKIPVEESATSQGGEVSAEVEEPIDLNGLWIQEDAEATYMTATIVEGKIGVFFILENDDTPWTYWVGTYEEPTTADEPYSWTSENTYGGNGLMASSADSKVFTYKDGKLTYEVSIQGQTGEVSLVRGDWDTSNIPASAFGSVNANTEEVLSLEIRDSGWLLKGGKWLYYYVRLYNPNDDIVVDLPSFRITARDAAGVLLGTQDQVLSVIYPQQEFVYGFQAFGVDEMPSTVDFQVLEPEAYNLKRTSAVEPYKQLEVVNTGVRSDKLVGEVVNHNDYSIDMAAVVAICRDASGNISEIQGTFVEQLAPGMSTPFELHIDSNAEITNYEIYANQW